MKKIYELALARFKKCNAKAKDAMAKEFGKKDGAELLAFLNSKLGIKPTAKKDAVKKPSKLKGPKIISQVTTPPSAAIPTVHNVHILDASTSMEGAKINNAKIGINSEIEELKKDDTVNYTHTFVSFSYSRDIQFHQFMVPMKNASPVTVQPRGMTALYDAIGQTLTKLRDNVKDGEKVLVKIFTDGQENASMDFSSSKISKLREELEAKGFTITFVGTQADVDNVVNTLRIHKSNTLVHDNTGAGVQKAFGKSLVATMSYSSDLKEGKDVTRGFYQKKVGTLD